MTDMLPLLCPWCCRTPKGYFYQDGENLQSMGPLLNMKPTGYYAHVAFGQCRYCQGEYIGLTITIFNREKAEELNDYL